MLGKAIGRAQTHERERQRGRSYQGIWLIKGIAKIKKKRR